MIFHISLRGLGALTVVVEAVAGEVPPPGRIAAKTAAGEIAVRLWGGRIAYLTPARQVSRSGPLLAVE